MKHANATTTDTRTAVDHGHEGDPVAHRERASDPPAHRSRADAIAWRCEDEEEALGLELVLERAGVPVRILEQSGAFVVEPDAAFADQAERIATGIARHFVRVDDRERKAALDARERWAHRAWWGSIALGLAAITMLAWS